MSDDLPIYSDSIFRGSNPFPALDRIQGLDLGACFERFDSLVDLGEGASNVARARLVMTQPGKAGLLEIHRTLFPDRSDAGLLRRSRIAALFPGQDCPDPDFIDRSMDNFEQWISAPSFAEIHPIEQASLALTRLLDIWPFDHGNRTVGVIFSNHFIVRAGYPPFFVLPEQLDEFERILSGAIRIETEPLVRAIYKCIERELNLVRG